MKLPKLIIASDGQHTAALLDGVFIGQGIERLDFSSETKDRKMKSTIRIMDLDVGSVSLERGTEHFSKALEAMAEEMTAPAATDAVKEIME